MSLLPVASRFAAVPAVLCVTILCAAWLAPAATAANEQSTERPRIGLILGGGGARGAAHIGVLRELERQRIPIDAIAGTSMGAIVGSLYASGKSPDELDRLVRDIDWADAFIDTPARQDLSFRRKQDDAAYPIPLELGVRDGEILLPKGIIQGQKLQLILRRELLHVSHIDDFDRLPIPFRAVASDIETGELHVIGSGDLATAARASMSAPGIFAPVAVDGRLLVDGGLVGNVPVDVAREMGVDVLIAVDVEFPLYPPEQLQSALSITEQMLTVMIRRETRRQLDTLDEDDVLIRPDLGEHGSTDFENILDVIEPGAVATAAEAERLAEFAMPAAEYERLLAVRRAQPGIPPTIEFVDVIGGEPLSAEVLKARLATTPGDTLDATALEEDAARLYGTNAYEIVEYQLAAREGETGVEFAPRQKSWGPNFLKAGLALEDDFEGSTAFNVRARLTMTGLNRLGAEWRNDLQIGTDPAMRSEFYQPLSFDSRYFIAPSISGSQETLAAFDGVRSASRYRLSKAAAGIDLGREIGRWGEVRIGAFRGTGNGRLRSGDPVLPNFDFDSAGVFAKFSVDTLDDAQIPKQGIRADFAWTDSRSALGADSNFDTLSAQWDQAWSWGKDSLNTLQFGAEYRTTFNGTGGIQDGFPLGGFLRLSGLERGELRGPHSALARLVYYREIRQNGGGFFDLPLYVGASVETGGVWADRSAIDFSSSQVNGSLFAGVDTWFGLLFLGAGFAENGDSSFYLFLGNPR